MRCRKILTRKIGILRRGIMMRRGLMMRKGVMRMGIERRVVRRF